MNKKTISFVLSIIFFFMSFSIVKPANAASTSFAKVNYLQCDSRWALVTHGKKTGFTGRMDLNACGILSIVNAVYNCTGRFIYPTDVADWAYNAGYYNKNGQGGINNNNVFFKCDDKFGDEYGFQVLGGGSGTSYSSELRNHVENKGTAVIHVVGHYMCLVDYDSSSGKFLVFDPYPGDKGSGKRRNLTTTNGDWKTAAQLATGNIKIDGYWLFESTGTPFDRTNPDNYPFPTRNIGYYGSAMKGDDVGWVQAVLYQLGYFTNPNDIDKSFGTGTKGTVQRFQADYGLDQDGSVGPITRAKLNECWIIKRDGTQVFSPTLEATLYLGSHRYEFYKGKTSWTSARDYAESIGGHLATVNGESEQNLILEYYNQHTDEKLWLGASDAEIDGDWRWVSGESFVYDNWATGEPNNNSGANPENYLGTTTGGYWNDFVNEPEDITGLIVEFEEAAVLDSTLYLNGHTYQFYKGFLPWTSAREYAESLGGYLMTVTSEQEQNLLAQYNAVNPTSELWLGASDAVSEGNWQWITGESFSYENWADEEPNNSNSLNNPENYLGVNTTGCWNDYSDSSGAVNGFIVEYEPCVKATLTSTEIGHNYVLYTVNTSWQSAKSFAEKTGGHLVTVTSAEEQELMDYFISGYENGCYWFGAENESTGTYRWVTDEPWNYENWEVGEPGGGSEHYIATCYGTKWEDWGNTSPSINGFIVEYEPTLKKSFVFEDHTYEIYEMSFCPWSDAQSIAQDKGGHLVTITSALEQSVINIELLDQEGTFWIGATDEQTEDVWEWVSGEGFSYTNWAAGEPNNLEYNENSAIISPDGFWWDTVNDNYEVNGFIVEYEPEHTAGDINGDNAVNNKDLTRLMKYLAGEDVTVNEAALDVNGDGIVNNKDLTRLMKYLAGEDVEIK